MRGYVFMLEAVFAGLVLIGFLLYLAQGYARVGTVPEHDFSGILPALDQEGLLRGHVFSGDVQGLQDEITLPGFQHSVQICAPAGACTGQVPDADNVWVSAHFLAGDDSYQPREVNLYVWEA